MIDHCQNPSVNIADATEQRLKLELPDANCNALVSLRIRKAVWPVAYAANYLHHKYKGQLLDADQLALAETFLLDHLNAEGVQELQNFESNRETYEEIANRCISPLAFWCRLEYDFPNLSELSKSIFIIPASTARLEGLFSQ